METKSDPVPVLSAPERTIAGTDFGYVCDPNVTLTATHSTTLRSRHEGCAGWWPSPINPDSTGGMLTGWRCACDCHENGAGWPGHDLAHR